MAQPHVLVLFNEPTLAPGQADAAAEREVLETTEYVSAILMQAGFRTSRLGINSDPAPLLLALQAQKPDVVFNLYEGTADHGQTEAYVAGLLDWLRVPHTGCPFQALALARDKPKAKLLLKGAGLPTPEFLVVERLPVPACPLRWPVIVKLANEDASIGIDQGSVVSSQEQLEQRVATLIERYHQPVLAEEFIDGRELDVAVIENPEVQVLPISEIMFTEPAGKRWRIVTYDAKWLADSSEDRATSPCCPANLSADLTNEVSRLAIRAYRLLDCRDYARVDFRIDERNLPFILEINPNPDFHPTAGLMRSLEAAGIEAAKFTANLVRRALDRGR
jgi:D-alanine-D-alanine ligase